MSIKLITNKLHVIYRLWMKWMVVDELHPLWMKGEIRGQNLSMMMMMAMIMMNVGDGDVNNYVDDDVRDVIHDIRCK
jgi:hypothetical protein